MVVQGEELTVAYMDWNTRVGASTVGTTSVRRSARTPVPMTRFTSASSRSISPPPPLPTRKRTPKSAKGASTRPAAARGGAARGLASRASTGPTKEQFDDLKRQIEDLKKSKTQPPAPAAQVRLSPRSKTPKARPRSETPARPKSPQHRSSRSRGAKRSTPRTRAPRSPEPSAWSPQHRPRSSARSPQHSARSEPRRRSPGVRHRAVAAQEVISAASPHGLCP